MAKTIFIVGRKTIPVGQESQATNFRLIEADSKHKALMHIYGEHDAVKATPRQVADLITAGVKVEVAGEGE